MVATSLVTFPADDSAAFSPLFVGAMVATGHEISTLQTQSRILSVPFSSGQWLLPRKEMRLRLMTVTSFSPLFIAAMVATPQM